MDSSKKTIENITKASTRLEPITMRADDGRSRSSLVVHLVC
jgi:hypothetical protein